MYGQGFYIGQCPYLSWQLDDIHSIFAGVLQQRNKEKEDCSAYGQVTEAFAEQVAAAYLILIDKLIWRPRKMLLLLQSLCDYSGLAFLLLTADFQSVDFEILMQIKDGHAILAVHAHSHHCFEPDCTNASCSEQNSRNNDKISIHTNDGCRIQKSWQACCNNLILLAPRKDSSAWNQATIRVFLGIGK